MIIFLNCGTVAERTHMEKSQAIKSPKPTPKPLTLGFAFGTYFFNSNSNFGNSSHSLSVSHVTEPSAV